MLKKYTLTFLNRFSAVLINFLIVAFTSNRLGASVRGEISIFIVNLTAILLFVNLLGGSSVSWFSNKMNTGKLLGIAFIGAVLIASASIPVFYITGYNLFIHLFGISLLASVYNNFQSVLVGKEKMNWYNFSFIFQPFLLLLALAIFYYRGELSSVSDYITGLYISYSVSLVVLLLFCNKWFFVKSENPIDSNWTNIIRFSSSAGTSNIIQFFNYRLNFYVLAYLFGNASIGLVSVAVSIAEGVWIIGNSIAVNVYSVALNQSDDKAKQLLARKAFRLSFWATLSIVLVLILLPEAFYTYLFGDDFIRIKSLLLILSPGIIFIGSSNIIGYYFAAQGKLKINNLKSVIGLISTIIFSILLIKPFGEEGACLTYSISYFFIFGWYLFSFRKDAGFKFSDFFIRKADFKS